MSDTRPGTRCAGLARDYESFGHETEFGVLTSIPVPATKEIAPTRKTVYFGSTLRFDDDGNLYSPKTNPPYVGEPAGEVGVARAKLQGAQSIFVRPKEKEQHRLDLYLDPETGLYTADCRDYETLKDWSLARDAADPKRYPQNAARINAERNSKLMAKGMASGY
ncbi:hypothetical protein B0H66DRAFT_595244 [Apodospora peruviana]|uniref:Uncharacterized protein n=1 Tax=Apodospora peruviana TaxID=516989 RepID=A0AAE0HTR0_9PEZI|nr:hypothetical protein B0H66DRAFT_595244 [Apodospora peruviana]